MEASHIILIITVSNIIKSFKKINHILLTLAPSEKMKENHELTKYKGYKNFPILLLNRSLNVRPTVIPQRRAAQKVIEGKLHPAMVTCPGFEI